MLKWDHWHIEPSSICALRCPRCPRAEMSESLLNKQLTLNFFQNQIGVETVKSIRKITFCGNDGDPIYCRELIEICAWLKHINPNIHLVIITNGSYRSADWWAALANNLDHLDELHWSLDGWDQHSNQQYRVNSDWASIQQGIDSFTAVNQSTYRVWATIAFRFNQHCLDHQCSMAQNLSFDLFQVTHSTKFGSKYPDAYGQQDSLEPTVPDLIAPGHRFRRVQHVLTEKNRPAQDLKEIFFQRAQDLDKQNAYPALCRIGNKGVFVNSQGEFYPCCWTANRYPHNQYWHQLGEKRFNLMQRTFQEIINDDFWSRDFMDFSSLECQNKCTQDRLQDREHITEW